MLGNLLALAQTVIPSQQLTLAKFTGRATNAAGFQVPTFADPVPLSGSAQPVPQSRYAALGLDFEKTYITLYTSADVVGVARDGSGDRVTFNGDTYSAESLTDWRTQNGWSAIICVRVPA